MVIINMFRNIFIGFGIANLSILTFVLIAENFGMQSIKLDVLKIQIIGGLCYGGFCGIISLIHDVKRLSLFIKSSIQLTGFLVGYVLFGSFLGWFGSTKNMVYMLLIFIGIYLIIWFIIYILQKRLAAELNNAIN